jgi:tetratricopeptide (TPR) repeat protein
MNGLMNLGMLYNEMACPDRAISYLEKALELARLTGEEARIGTIYMNMGHTYRLMDEPVQAEQYGRAAEAIFQKFPNAVFQPWVWMNLGEACFDQGKWQEAELYLTQALASFRNSNYLYGEIKVMMSLVEYELARGNPSQVITYFRQGEALMRRYDPSEKYPYLKALLKKYRPSLTE